jgi:tRNA threonylcarbamoyladenosine biosynthesis protein TsaE
LSLGLGLSPDQVSSPTFALVHEYPGRIPLIHVDLYRLPVPEVEFLMELEDYWQQPVITVIEWAERLNADLPEEYLDITLVWEDDQTRLLEISGIGPRGENLAVAYQALWPGAADQT